MARKTVWVIESRRLDRCVEECLTTANFQAKTIYYKASPMWPSCGAHPEIKLVVPRSAKKSVSRGKSVSRR